MKTTPTLTLDDLATDWLSRRMTGLAAMPGLNNDIGSIQMEADPAAIKHMIFPPYSAGNETTWVTLLNGRHIALQTSHVEIRWRAYQVERRCEAGDFHLESLTSLLPAESGCTVRLTITNRSAEERRLTLGFLCSGRAANEGTDGYAWGVPSIPTDVLEPRIRRINTNKTSKHNLQQSLRQRSRRLLDTEAASPRKWDMRGRCPSRIHGPRGSAQPLGGSTSGLTQD